MTAQAKNLSGGQKRKLSVGIAILGDPKVPVRNLTSVFVGGKRVERVFFVCVFFFKSRHQSFSDNVGLWLFLSDPALRRAHGRHGPLLQAPGVVSAEESPGRQSHCAQHALHGRGRHPCWYECFLLCKIHKPTLWTGNIDQKLCFIFILDDGISGSSSLINILIRSWCCFSVSRKFSVFS